MHGYIVYSDESSSQELWSQEDAVEEIRRAKSAGKITSIEIKTLMEAIKDSLPSRAILDALDTIKCLTSGKQSAGPTPTPTTSPTTHHRWFTPN